MICRRFADLRRKNAQVLDRWEAGPGKTHHTIRPNLFLTQRSYQTNHHRVPSHKYRAKEKSFSARYAWFG
ncbi:MAG: hypothetical protein DMG51_06970 [Acidobacteria bacterium]|nr:MAG: hypothetical protein DMG51_06970 [Acidobacteriota bacterium]